MRKSFSNLKINSVKYINMKYLKIISATIAIGINIASGANLIPFVYDTEKELTATGGDFDGNGLADLLLVDKGSGKYRIAYQFTQGEFTWVNHRVSGVKDVSGVGLGKLFSTDKDGIAMTAADANQIVVVSAESTTSASTPIPIPPPVLGPNVILPVSIGGEGKSQLYDLYLGSIYNDPDPYKVTFFRNKNGKFEKFYETKVPGAPGKPNRIQLKKSGKEFVSVLSSDDKGDTLRVENLDSGKIVVIGQLTGLTAGSDYTAGYFSGGENCEFIFYNPGSNFIKYVQLGDVQNDRVKFANPVTYQLDSPIFKVYTVQADNTAKLLVISGKGEKAGIYDFNGKQAPSLISSITPPEKMFYMGAIPFTGGFHILLSSGVGKFSMEFKDYRISGNKVTDFKSGQLPSMDDTDEFTIPLIHKQILASLAEKAETDMKPYTNTIPGSGVTYAMVPIPGGEFLMGSPTTEKGHKPDEEPQHRVKISPFWMGRFEVTWNEYELFMYPDDEKKLRTQYPSNPEVDKLSDAITRPSKPYVEMSFGMGKDGYPAIAMTQHAANKYCQWLSAKTGHFYRLPTEAEWEYACRAGTKTAYFFGEDPTQLNDCAWTGQNSDFKYHKVGEKKPNPWGLYDILGNVLEFCLDQYDPNYYKTCGEFIVDPWNKATKPYPHSVRGGSWDDEDVALFRSAARRFSDRSWKATDPQLPKSHWYFSDVQWCGFRLVRPLKVPPPEDLAKYWISGVEKD